AAPRDVADRADAGPDECCLGHRSYAPEPPDGQWMEERLDAVGCHLDEAVRLPDVARDLRNHLPRADPDGDREPGRLAHTVLQEAPDRERRAEERYGRGHVDERLVQRERLDGRAHRLEELSDTRALAAVFRH